MRWLCLFSVLFVSYPACAQLYQWKDEHGRTHYSDKPPPGQATEAPAAESAPAPEPAAAPIQSPSSVRQPLNVDDVAYSRPAYSDALALRHLFIQREFAALNDALELRLREVQSDIVRELTLRAAYDIFAVTSAETETLLNQWIEAFPKSYQPYLARAIYYEQRGWSERGGAYAHRTPSANISRMRSAFDLAQRDLRQVLALNERALPAYWVLIDMARTEGDRNVSRQVLSRGLKFYPNSYVLRWSYVQGLEPRWGGSEALVQDFVELEPKTLKANPRLQAFKNYPIFDQGLAHYRKKEYEEALASFDEALKAGAHPTYSYYRGRSLYKLERYPEAVKALSQAMVLRPDIAGHYYWRSRALYYGGFYADAVADIQRAYALDSEDEYIANFRKTLFARTTNDYVKGMDKNWAREVVKTEPSKYDENQLFIHAKAQLALGMNAEAEQSLLQLIELKPNEYEYFKWLDFALYRLARLEEIIAHWDDFLSRNTTSADAVMQRGITYFQLENYPAAMEDAARASELGSEQGQHFYQKLKAFTVRPSPTEGV
ncbi:DUF4124 domain-containing protein [Gilvimarinus algae]|uniref:DUF4124 domain-containing protein n=1 Tax=Gilvimarinus algae TaxID=3058037 RepID=A0ABT8TI39_9GAMM|nr:tetratricopeptide repeat protein [Gilvimarinus sp. SDUM040014]MDO3383752.1 DUF4124 domain-containing protein [Gilvimarinus sp. SDUM040014]